MILRHTRVKSCSATRAVPVPGQGTLPLIHRRESHATSDLVKAPRSGDRERDVMQKPEQKRTPRKGIHPTPSPDLYLIPRGTEGPCLFPRGFFSGSVGPPLSCCRCCYCQHCWSPKKDPRGWGTAPRCHQLVKQSHLQELWLLHLVGDHHGPTTGPSFPLPQRHQQACPLQE